MEAYQQPFFKVWSKSKMQSFLDVEQAFGSPVLATSELLNVAAVSFVALSERTAALAAKLTRRRNARAARVDMTGIACSCSYRRALLANLGLPVLSVCYESDGESQIRD